jgi:hypothetical protein
MAEETKTRTKNLSKDKKRGAEKTAYSHDIQI